MNQIEEHLNTVTQYIAELEARIKNLEVYISALESIIGGHKNEGS